MSNLMFAQMGLNAIQTIGAASAANSASEIRHIQAKAQGYASVSAAKSAQVVKDTQEAVQAYRNTMADLSTANKFNAITQNEIAIGDASAKVARQIQIAALEQEGSANVAAAAAGVTGGSTRNVMQGLRASASRAQQSRVDALQGQYRQLGQERTNTELASIYSKDTTVFSKVIVPNPVIPKATRTSALLGLAVGTLQIWDSHQTPDRTIAAGWSGTVGTNP